jgi:hypothetical protein
MTNRGNDLGLRIDRAPTAQDPTARVVARILKAKPAITIKDISEMGDVVFTVDLKPFGVKAACLRQASLLKTHLLADFVGEFLLRQNLNLFMDLLMNQSYERMVGLYQHRNYGMWIDGLT